MTATVAEEATPAPAAEPKKPKKRGRWQAWLWLAPALFLLSVFLVWPVIRTIWISFHKGSTITPTREFVGLDNYVEMFTNDPAFIKYDLPPWSALFNSALWVVLFTLGVIAFGLLVGVLADKVKYEKLSKAIVFLPLVVSFTAASVVFRLVYSTDPNIGLLNALLGLIGLGPVAFLGEANIVNFAIIGAGIWVWTALSMTILAAAYKALPEETHEAAAVDGANEWQVFWRVSLPQMKGPIIVVAVTMIINALKAVDLVLIMTTGGPGFSSRIVGFTVYWEIFNNNFAGYGSAVAVVLLIMMAPLMWWQMRQIRATEAR
jgi:alpha-glucoside transport system permease protein